MFAFLGAVDVFVFQCFFCLCVFGGFPLFKHFSPALFQERSARVLLSGANLHLHTKNTSKWRLCFDLFHPFFLWYLSSPTKIVHHHHPGDVLFEVLLRRGYLSGCATSRCINHRWCTMSFGTKELFVSRLLEPSGLGWDGGWIEKMWNGGISRQQFGNSTFTLSIHEVGEWPDFFFRSGNCYLKSWEHQHLPTSTLFKISLAHKSATDKWQAIFLFWGAKGLRATGGVGFNDVWHCTPED